MTQQTRITYNGKSYSSIEEMPEEVRESYRKLIAMLDKDGNGVPDMLEGKGIAGKLLRGLITTMGTKESIVIDGKPIGSISDLPPQLQEIAAQLLQGKAPTESASILIGAPASSDAPTASAPSSHAGSGLHSAAPQSAAFDAGRKSPGFEGVSVGKLLLIGAAAAGFFVYFSLRP